MIKKNFAAAIIVFNIFCFGLIAQETETSPKKQKKAKEPKTKTTEVSEKKNYTGWIDTTGKDIELNCGIIRLNVRPKLGTFNISVINDDEKAVPVLFTGNEFSTSSFYLKYNKKILKLSADANIKSAAKKMQDSLEMLYVIDNVADINVIFQCCESLPGNGYDMLKITSTVVNKSPKKAQFAQKLILDTTLGETDKFHFYTSENVPVESEVMYRTMKNEKWFVSRNNNAEMQILLSGADISPIDIVALANYATLQKKSWEPEMLSYRAFDTVLSYNNSAIGIYWPEKSIGVGSKITSSFYLAFAVNGEKAEGYAYIQEKESQGVKNNTIPTSVNVDSEIKIVEKPVNVDPKPVELKKSEPAPVATPKPVVPEKIEKEPAPTVKFDVNSLTKEQLSPEYIQNLLDRILELEANDAIVNREELLSLNQELDAILELLR